jgi:hypothetical protein
MMGPGDAMLSKELRAIEWEYLMASKAGLDRNLSVSATLALIEERRPEWAAAPR